jgi:hypothetical protein
MEEKLEITTFDLSNETVSLWEDDDQAKSSALERELEDSDELVSFINRYQKDRWEVHSIDQVTIDTAEGSIYIEFTRHLFNGCRDLDAQDDDDLSVSFIVHPKQGEITITGNPIPEERSTFEEF